MKNLKNGIIRLLSIILATSIFFACSSNGKSISGSISISVKTLNVAFEDLQGAVLISGMSGCENLFLDKDSMRTYVTDLSGYLYLVDGETHETMEIETSIKIGNMGFGIDKGPDGYLYFSASENTSDSCVLGNCNYNAAIYKTDMNLELPVTKITEDYRGINGVTFDASGGCYFTSSTFTFTLSDLQGEVYRMQVTADGVISPPEVFLADAGFANGLYFDSNQELIFFSQTTQAVFTFSPSNPSLEEVVSVFADDLCTDKNGRVWMSCSDSLQMYNPEIGVKTIYFIEGFGSASSCRIREEGGNEFIYITELNQPMQPPTSFDGRGIAIIPLNLLLQL